MITLRGKYKNGAVQIGKDPDIAENDQVYVLVLNKDRKTGINRDRNKLISEAKKAARKRLRSLES